jgi:hypothetical protein
VPPLYCLRLCGYATERTEVRIEKTLMKANKR